MQGNGQKVSMRDTEQTTRQAFQLSMSFHLGQAAAFLCLYCTMAITEVIV